MTGFINKLTGWCRVCGCDERNLPPSPMNHSALKKDLKVGIQEPEQDVEPSASASPVKRVLEMKAQSPIDICELEMPINLLSERDVEFFVSSGADAEIAHHGKNFHVDWTDKTNYITIKGKVYYALQFHFHTPSEHTINGEAKAMELHLVHQAADGSLAVVGIFLKEGKENPFLAQFWHEIPSLDMQTRNKVHVGQIDASILDLSGHYYRYGGSLTTPPYSEGVEWIVMKDMAEVSSEQIQIFKNMLPGPANARPVQALNNRQVSLVL